MLALITQVKGFVSAKHDLAYAYLEAGRTSEAAIVLKVRHTWYTALLCVGVCQFEVWGLYCWPISHKIGESSVFNYKTFAVTMLLNLPEPWKQPGPPPTDSSTWVLRQEWKRGCSDASHHCFSGD